MKKICYKYTKGTEKDFKDAPENALERLESDKGGEDHLVGWLVEEDNGKRFLVGINGYREIFTGSYGYRIFISASRYKTEEEVNQAVGMIGNEPLFTPAPQDNSRVLDKDMVFGDKVLKKGTKIEILNAINFNNGVEMVPVKDIETGESKLINKNLL